MSRVILKLPTGTVPAMNERYYDAFAAAFIRASEPKTVDEADGQVLARGLARGLRLHAFKRLDSLPRVQRVIGVLKSLQPTTILDVGTGRGVFLWALMDALPRVPVVAIDVSPNRVAGLQAVRRGGVSRLSVVRASACHLCLPTGGTDVVTALEVLEHIPDVPRATREIVRVARRAVVVSVPSSEDTNPGHLHLIPASHLEGLLLAAGCRRVHLDGVRGHVVAVAMK